MKFAFRLAVSALLLGVIVWQVEPRVLLESTRAFTPAVLLVVIGVYTLDRLLMTYKWLLLLRSRGLRLPLLHGMQIYCSAILLGLLLPSTVGADTLRALHTTRAGLPTGEVLASIVVERALGFLATLTLGLVGIALISLIASLPPALELVLWAGGVLLCGGALALAASFSDWGYQLLHDRLLGRFEHTLVARKLRELHDTYRGYEADRPTLLAFFALTVAEQLAPALVLWLLARGVGLDVPLHWLVASAPLAMLVTRIPISLGGIGVFEGALLLLLAPLGVSAAALAPLLLASRFCEITSWLPWWAVHSLRSREAVTPSA